MAGTVQAIYICSAATQPMVEVREARAVPGRGLEGDRYFSKTGTYSERPGTGREVTLIAQETLGELKAELGIDLAPRDSRRNLLTQGVPLNEWVGKRFRVGEVTLQGMRLCEPCAYLESLTQPGVLEGLVHRGGLRAKILQGGVIRAADAVEALEG